MSRSEVGALEPASAIESLIRSTIVSGKLTIQSQASPLSLPRIAGASTGKKIYVDRREAFTIDRDLFCLAGGNWAGVLGLVNDYKQPLHADYSPVVNLESRPLLIVTGSSA